MSVCVHLTKTAHTPEAVGSSHFCSQSQHGSCCYYGFHVACKVLCICFDLAKVLVSKKKNKIIFSGQISLLFFKPCRGETFECLSSLKPIICHGATWCEWQCFCEMNMCLNCVSIPQEKKPYAIYIF